MSLNLPIINEDKCPAPSCGTGDGTGQDSAPSLDLRPGGALLCQEATLNFKTYLVSAQGEQLLGYGLAYSTSDASILAIDSSTGAATVTGSGIATVTVTWQGLTTLAQITVLAGVGDDCCAQMQLRIVVVGDESLSMQQLFGGKKRRKLASSICSYGLSPNPPAAILSARTKAAGVVFSDAALLFQAFTEDPTTVLYPLSRPAGMGDQTSIQEGLNLALTTLSGDPGDQQIIVLFSDGIDRPELTDDERDTLIDTANNFKTGGGIIIVFAMGATSEGFNLLRQIASGGFFVSVVPPHSATVVEDNAAKLINMLCLLCAGDRPTTGYTGGHYTYGCETFDNGPQVPDPNDYGDVEEGVPVPTPPLLPKLPCPSFNVLVDGGGSHEILHVEGFPDAFIRFTYGTSPADPSFLYPSSPATGIDYDGAYAVSGITLTPPVTFKAIARQAGYADSDVCSMSYS